MSPNLRTISIERWKRQQSVRERYGDLEAYIDFAEASIIKLKAKTESDAALQEVFYPDRITDEDIERYQEDVRRLDESFPQGLRASALAMVQATLEHQLSAIARFYCLVKEIPAEELTESIRSKKSTLWGTKSFLKGKCKTEGGSEYWKTIKHFSLVRNAVAHNQGLVDDSLHSPRETRAAIEALKSVKLIDNQIYLEREASSEFLNAAKYLCLELLRA